MALAEQSRLIVFNDIVILWHLSLISHVRIVIKHKIVHLEMEEARANPWRLFKRHVARRKQARWGQSGLVQTQCPPGHFSPDSSNLVWPNALPLMLPCPCMQHTPISTHSGMPRYYGGPLRLGRGPVTVPAKWFLVRYCFSSLVRPLVV